MSDAVTRLARRVGVMSGYRDLDGTSHKTSRDTEMAILRAMGIAAENSAAVRDALDDLDAEGRPGWEVCEAGNLLPASLVGGAEWAVLYEDGAEVEGRGSRDLPVLPLGRHLLRVGPRRVWLLSAPPALPQPQRTWGVTAPLAGLRTAEEGGLGSYVDLGRAAAALSKAGASFLGINPVHAGFPCDETAFSPYSPSHRRWLNTLHIDTGAVLGNFEKLIDYPAAIRAQRRALRTAFAGDLDPGFEAYLSEKGKSLQSFALHQTLSERHGAYWCDWPCALRRSDGPEVAAAARSLAQDVRFHAWAQYRAERQLAEAAGVAEAAGMAFGLYLDLAVGVHPDGAETWETPKLFARGASLGAPPDRFSPAGQNWTLAPFIPHELEAEGFASFAAILRRQFQFARLVRIDHILGFDRAFWALNAAGVAGAYVKMPLAALLAVTRIEAARAGTTVIGEDLGNIPSGLQAALRASGLLGCRLMMFERNEAGFKPPEAYEPMALASFSTHDLATWSGWQSGFDLRAQCDVGQISEARKRQAQSDRKAEVTAFRDMAGAGGLHGALAETASHLVAVQAENVFELEAQANLPGTIDAYPNWRLRLPVGIDDYAQDARLAGIAAAMTAAGR